MKLFALMADYSYIISNFLKIGPGFILKTTAVTDNKHTYQCSKMNFSMIIHYLNQSPHAIIYEYPICMVYIFGLLSQNTLNKLYHLDDSSFVPLLQIMKQFKF